jgi:hypothetical protein
MDIAIIKANVRDGKLVFSIHAEEERMDEDLTAQDVITAILNGEILEQYPDTGRGESCLVLGFVGEQPVHVICGWRAEAVVIITVYIPTLPFFTDPWTRSK